MPDWIAPMLELAILQFKTRVKPDKGGEAPIVGVWQTGGFSHETKDQK